MSITEYPQGKIRLFELMRHTGATSSHHQQLEPDPRARRMAHGRCTAGSCLRSLRRRSLLGSKLDCPFVLPPASRSLHLTLASYQPIPPVRGCSIVFCAV